MYGVILAGGSGSRLKPATKYTNKHLLNLGKYPMILHSIEKLKDAGVTDICLITSPDYAGRFVDILGSGKEFGVNVTFKIQDEPNGIAGALSLAKDVVGNDRFVVILADNFIEDSLKGKLGGFNLGGAKIFVKEVPNPEHFGCPTYDENGQIVEIIEKPINPPSSDAIIGVYVFDRTVFGYIDQIQPSKRGELEIADVLNFYVKSGTLKHSRIKNKWLDCGTWENYYEANKWFFEQEKVNA